MSTKSAVVNGNRMVYEDDGKGPTLVFLHGLGMNRSIWDAQVEAFRSEWRIIRPDLRGFGDSDKPLGKGAYSVQTFASDVAALLDSLNAWPIVLVGTSLGGYVALALALNEQKRVTRVALCHTACSRRVPPEVMAERLAALQTGTMKDYANVAVRHAVAAGASEALRDRVRDILGANDQKAFIEIFSGTTIDFDLCGRLGSLAIPALIVSSEEDKVVPYSRSLELRDGLPNAVLRTISGVGHLSYMEKPEEFNRALRDFLSAGPGMPG